MKKRIFSHIGYWLLVLLFLTLFFGQNWENHLLAFYFSTLLLPIVMGTSYFFNLYLVPRYLLSGKYWTLILYSFYMLVVSLYLEMMVAVFAFAVIANYKLAVMSVMSTSILVLGVTLYFIVFVTSFIRLVIQFRKKSTMVEQLARQQEQNRIATLTFRADRKTQTVPEHELIYFESLDDYVQITTEATTIKTREKISQIQQRLPDHFIRIHRSFIVNQHKVTSFSATELKIHEITLPISRSYKKQVLEKLQGESAKIN